MKKPFLKPGYEFIFSLCLIVILALPPVLMAQTQKDVEIKIENGDTTVNGKKLKDLSVDERQSALRDINHLNGNTIRFKRDGHGNVMFKRDGDIHLYSFKRKSGDTADRMMGRLELRQRAGGDDMRGPITRERVIIKDSLGNIIEVNPGKMKRMEPDMNFSFRMKDDGRSDMMAMRERPFTLRMDKRERRDSQDFNYTNTDKEGISTHVRFSVSEASNDDLKKSEYVEGPKLEISDLNLVPQFSAGKILLMFNLPSKLAGEAKLTDSDGKILWSEKSAGGSFSKTFALGLNGIYYLQVKQGHAVVVKRIIKEE